MFNRPKRVNKKKEEIANLAKQKQEVEHDKALLAIMWPFVQNELTIYDAQTVVNALAGFIKYDLEVKQSEYFLKDLAIDLKNQDDSPIKEAMLHLLEVFKDEKAIKTTNLLERFGKTLQGYASHVYMKNPMSTLKIEDIVAK